MRASCGLSWSRRASSEPNPALICAVGPSRPAEPPDLRAERLRPARVEERSRDAKEGTQSPCGDPQLVELLGIGSEAGAGVVDEDGTNLCGQGGAERGVRRCRRADRRRLARHRKLERPEQLGPLVRLARARAPKLLLQAS